MLAGGKKTWTCEKQVDVILEKRVTWHLGMETNCLIEGKIIIKSGAPVWCTSVLTGISTGSI